MFAEGVRKNSKIVENFPSKHQKSNYLKKRLNLFGQCLDHLPDAVGHFGGGASATAGLLLLLGKSTFEALELPTVAIKNVAKVTQTVLELLPGHHRTGQILDSVFDSEKERLSLKSL